MQRFVADRLEGMRADVRRVDEVERAPSGKLRLVRNDWMAQRGREK
ncbi:MAG: hypothetical protein U5R14_15780 [Gemmatimonadota bacterium]|nr:hypothetical protein [Gemmatimonadota bacterium]